MLLLCIYFCYVFAAYGHKYDYFRPTTLSVATAMLKFKDERFPKNFQPLGWKGPLVNSQLRLGCSRLSVQLGFENLQGQQFHIISGQPVPWLSFPSGDLFIFFSLYMIWNSPVSLYDHCLLFSPGAIQWRARLCLLSDHFADVGYLNILPSPALKKPRSI